MALEWLNYHHLLYFWLAAREGSVTKASALLRLSQPTVSGQIRLLEQSLGGKLFQKSGRQLALTEFGRMVYRYADEIFGIGRELVDVVKGRPPGRPARLTVGVSDVLPKLLVFRILDPVIAMKDTVRMTIHEDHPERLLAELSLQAVDLVLSDTPVAPHVHVKAYNHLLGTSPVGIYARPKTAAKFKANFPRSLDGAPWLLPVENSSLRRSLDQWFDKHGIRPDAIAEFQDSALLKVFAEAHDALFAAPSVTDAELRRIYGTAPVGQARGIEERFYAITVERRVKNPAVMAIADSAHGRLFAKTAARKAPAS